MVKPGTQVNIFSDFLNVNEQSYALMSGLVRHNQVSAYWIYDKTEFSHWAAGRYTLDQRGARKVVSVPDNPSNSWLDETLQAHRQTIETLMSRFAIPLIPISCNQPVSPQVLGHLSQP